MVVVGELCRIDADVSTSAIINPSITLAGDPAEIAAACLAGVDPRIAERLRPGMILLVDGVLGVGTDASDAALALLAGGIVVVIARRPVPAFVDAAQHLGLPVVAVDPVPPWHDGDLLRIDLRRGQLRRRGDSTFDVTPTPDQVLVVMRQAMMWQQTRRSLEEEGDDG
jgi:3-isopropylmalate dehydratase small subunit